MREGEKRRKKERKEEREREKKVGKRKKGWGGCQYVDGMVIKFNDLSIHIKDLEEVFAQLRKYSMRLNPEKCVFGIGGSF